MFQMKRADCCVIMLYVSNTDSNICKQLFSIRHNSQVYNISNKPLLP